MNSTIPGEATRQPPDPAEPKASIIIPCCNALAYTQSCLEHVLASNLSRCELIVVDNGSSDQTPAYLHQVRNGQDRLTIEIIRNETNRGFPAACNQAMARARGKHLVFLNNDVLVPPFWLDDLVAAAESDDSVGLVGAVSNFAAGPQLVKPGYADPSGWKAYAAAHRARFRGKRFPVRRLTSICLLVRRSVFDKIGGWDEDFGLGYYDDDDLCVRATNAGFGLSVAQDVYVHHFGCSTFKALGIDVAGQLRQSAAVFRRKWSRPAASTPSAETDPARSRSEAPAVSPAVSEDARPIADRPFLSLCMIVKNEEANLGPCLESVAGLADETIVVDTGSADRTREIAADHGAKVFEFPWIDDFAAARNESFRHATGRWILVMDADDRFDADNQDKLRMLLRSIDSDKFAFVMKVRSSTEPDGKSHRLLDQVRLMPNHPEIRWEYRIHEQIVPSLNRRGIRMKWTEIVVDHLGYQDPAHRRRKLERNLRLLQIEHERSPKDPFGLFNLGRTYQDLGSIPEAVALFKKSLDLCTPGLSIRRKLYSLLASGHEQLRQPDEAREACRSGLVLFPNDPELLYQYGVMSVNAKKYADAETILLRLLSLPPADAFDMFDADIRGFRARHQLGKAYAGMSRFREAEAQWRLAVEERPDAEKCWFELGELLLSQQRWTELDELATKLERMWPPPTDAWVQSRMLRIRSLQARKQDAEVEKALRTLCSEAPRALPAKVMLSELLLKRSQWKEAHAVLTDIVDQNPKDANAARNLRLLKRRIEAPAE